MNERRKPIWAGRCFSGRIKKQPRKTREKDMFRRILLASVLGIGVVGALAIPTVAEARPPEAYRHDEHDRHWQEHRRSDFEVLYRDANCPWKVSGEYHNRAEANRAAEQLRCHGFQVEIRPCA
jgi:hypothetical protein